MTDVSNGQGAPAAPGSALDCDEGLLHLSQWKPARTLTWSTPRFSIGLCPINRMHIHNQSTAIMSGDSGPILTRKSRMDRDREDRLVSHCAPHPIRYNAMVDEFVDASPSRGRARHLRSGGRAPRARSTPRCPSFAPQPPHSHPSCVSLRRRSIINLRPGRERLQLHAGAGCWAASSSPPPAPTITAPFWGAGNR
jgi:hypothetical protein